MLSSKTQLQPRASSVMAEAGSTEFTFEEGSRHGSSNSAADVLRTPDPNKQDRKPQYLSPESRGTSPLNFAGMVAAENDNKENEIEIKLATSEVKQAIEAKEATKRALFAFPNSPSLAVPQKDGVLGFMEPDAAGESDKDEDDKFEEAEAEMVAEVAQNQPGEPRDSHVKAQMAKKAAVDKLTKNLPKSNVDESPTSEVSGLASLDSERFTKGTGSQRKSGHSRHTSGHSHGMSSHSRTASGPSRSASIQSNSLQSSKASMQKSSQGSKEYEYLSSHLSSMPGSWITQQNPQFEDQDMSFNDPDGSRYNDIVNSLHSAGSIDLPRDLTYGSLNGEMEGGDPSGSIPSSSETSSSASSRRVSRRSLPPRNTRRSMVTSKIPDLPDDMPGAKSNFKSALETMLTNAFGWRERVGEEGDDDDNEEDKSDKLTSGESEGVTGSGSATAHSIRTSGTSGSSGSPTSSAESSADSAASDALARRTSLEAQTRTQQEETHSELQRNNSLAGLQFVEGTAEVRRFTNPLLSASNSRTSLVTSRSTVALDSIKEAEDAESVLSEESPEDSVMASKSASPAPDTTRLRVTNPDVPAVIIAEGSSEEELSPPAADTYSPSDAASVHTASRSTSRQHTPLVISNPTRSTARRSLKELPMRKPAGLTAAVVTIPVAGSESAASSKYSSAIGTGTSSKYSSVRPTSSKYASVQPASSRYSATAGDRRSSAERSPTTARSARSAVSLATTASSIGISPTTAVTYISAVNSLAGTNPPLPYTATSTTTPGGTNVQRITASFSSIGQASSFTSKGAVESLLSASSRGRTPSSLRTSTAASAMSEESGSPDMFDPDDASALFVCATYQFDASTLESENDAAICLSFQQGDLAFTYNLDESGWGEVILVDSLKRGWVPMNYFKSAVSDSIQDAEGNSNNEKLAYSRLPLKVLLRNAGKFLLNPQSKPFYLGGHLRGYVFDVECFNGITDGVRKVLIDTDCISRSNTIVQTRPSVRHGRKKLLQTWSDLMAKAKEYMHTMDPGKIEYLQLLTFDVLKRAMSFLDVWGEETANLDLEHSEEQQHRQELSTFSFDLVFLSSPPLAAYRVNEVYDQLVSYLSLVSGRIDLVEHNVQGCSVLENVVGQVNLLTNEGVFIMKYLRGRAAENLEAGRISESQARVLPSQLRMLDANAAKLDQGVEELNSFVRVMIDVATRRRIQSNLDGASMSRSTTSRSAKSSKSGKSLARTVSAAAPPLPQQDAGLYFYSREGGAIVINACKLIGVASSSYRILKAILKGIPDSNDLILPSSRKYPNYVKMGLTPDEFIQRCSVGLMGDKAVRKQVSEYRKNRPTSTEVQPKNGFKRFSVFRAGNSGDMQISDDGLDFLAGISASRTNSPMDTQFAEDVRSREAPASPLSMHSYDAEADIIRGADGQPLGASFKALVALLTDETKPPSYFFTSTFFLTFRIFANGSMLLEELVTRFDVGNETVSEVARLSDRVSAGFSSPASRIKARRKLVCKAFQLWLESYWKPRADYVLLAPLINFFNEAVKGKLPIEAYQLLLVASKLVGQPPVETMKDKLNYCNNIDSDQQLLPRTISPKLHKKEIMRVSAMHDLEGNAFMSELDAYNSFMDDIDSYGLKDVDEDGLEGADNRKSSAIRKSLNLGLHLELADGTSSSMLLTTNQLFLIKSVVMSYRKMLGKHWCEGYDVEESPETKMRLPPGSTVAEYGPVDTQSLIDAWWSTSQESWKCLNHSLILLNFNGLEMAKQLTLIESKMFCSIRVGELLNQNFTTKKLHLNLSPNIQRSILFTNLLSEYVIESILQPDIELRRRVHFFKCWLKVAISCLYLRNFNSLASIMTSLQSFLITRIRPIWAGLSGKYQELFHYLASIIHPDRNYHIYRDKLRDLLESNLEDNLEIPVVPYLSLFLQDLTFVVDGNPNYRNNSKSFLNQKLINIDKYFKITQIISDIQAVQVPYRDTGELGTIYNSAHVEQMRTQAILNLQKEIRLDENEGPVNFADMFDIAGVPCLQELVFLEIWKVKQNNTREEDRAWKLSCAILPKDQVEGSTTMSDVSEPTVIEGAS